MGIILSAIIGTAALTVIGGGSAYFLYLKTRPKKETWDAKIYQLGEGVRPSSLDKNNIKLQDLKPYTEDILEKVEKAPGITIYRLQRLNKPTPAIEGDVVEYWGREKRTVSILKHKGSFTLLKAGYDKESGSKIFHPMPHSKINLIKSEMAIRKDRLHKEKDILTAITPWIVAGICMLGLVAIAYIQIGGYVKMAESLEKASVSSCNEIISDWKSIGDLSGRGGQTPPQNDLGQQEPEKDIPSVE